MSVENINMTNALGSEQNLERAHLEGKRLRGTNSHQQVIRKYLTTL